MGDQSAAWSRALGATFATGGERYQRLRPGYPSRAVDWVVDQTPAGGVVVDVGAGTGKFTAALVSRGFAVVAVDPSADMLDQLARLLPGVRTQRGTGEATGLADGSAHLATFAQSWHWVEPTAGCLELARVLKPGGRAAWVWNVLDVREPWVAGLSAIWHAVDGAETTDLTRYSPQLDAAFGPVESTTVDWSQPMRLADLAELVTTRSYYLAASASERRRLEADLAAFLEAQFPGAETVGLPYRTHCFHAVRI